MQADHFREEATGALIPSQQRQFVIASVPVYFGSAWRSFEHMPGLFVSHCPRLRVARGVSREGEPVALLGTPIECDSEAAEPSVEAFTRESLWNHTRTWSNRWALMLGRSLVTDAGGLLGVFFVTTAGKGVLVSSSPRLLGRIVAGSDERVRGKTYGPATPHRSVLQLLPGQELDCVDGMVHQPKRALFPRIEGTKEDLLGRYCQLLRTCLLRIAAQEGQSLLLSLSGGADSRRNFAAALAAGVRVEPFTFLKPYWSTSDADRLLPRKLTERVGVTLRTVDTRGLRENAELRAFFASNSSYSQSERPGELLYYFARGAWNITFDRPVIDGQAYELVSNYYYREIDPFANADEMLSWNYESTEASRVAAKHYLAKASGGAMTDLRDFAFLLGNMMNYGQMYNAMDLWCRPYCPANSALLYALAQSVDPRERQDKRFLKEVTDRLEPRFAGIPTNPNDFPPKYAVQLLRRHGIRGLLRIGFGKLGLR